MTLTVLGCRAGMPADGQASSGYLVSVGEGAGSTVLLLDCGPGVASALSEVGTPGLLTGVVITHVHLDHCYDLLPIGKTLLAAGVRYPVAGAPPQREVSIPRLPLHVPGGSADLFARLAALFPVQTVPALDRAFDLAFDVREYTPGSRIALGAAEVRLELLDHAAPNCGFRVESADGTLVYTGDTRRTPALDDLAAGADLLLAECTLDEPDSGPHGHLCAEDAADVAATAGVGRLVLTHFTSADTTRLEELRRRAAARFDGPVHLATPFARFPLLPPREAVLPTSEAVK